MGKTYQIIKDLCKAKGTSINKMCKTLGLSPSLFSELKSGRTEKLSAQTLESVASFFNVPVDYLLDLGEIDPSDIPPEPPVSRHQILFALFGDVADEITDAEYEEVQRYCDMVRLRKLEEKRSKNESN